VREVLHIRIAYSNNTMKTIILKLLSFHITSPIFKLAQNISIKDNVKGRDM